MLIGDFSINRDGEIARAVSPACIWAPSKGITPMKRLARLNQLVPLNVLRARRLTRAKRVNIPVRADGAGAFVARPCIA